MGSLAAVRDVRDVTKRDVGKAGATDAEQPAEFRDLLATIIPTLPIAAYSALLALVLQWIDGERNQGNDPGDYEVLRWVFVAGLVLSTAWLVVMAHHHRRPTSSTRFAKLEVGTTCLAAAAWGLSGPGTPLALHFSGLGAVVAPVVVLFVVIIILTPLVPKLQKRAG